MGQRAALRRRCRIDDNRGARPRQAHIAHGHSGRWQGLDPRIGKGSIQPPLCPAPAAVKARKAPVGMAQRAQDGGDPFDCRKEFGGTGAAHFGQRLFNPCEQGEQVQQVFRIAAGDTAAHVNLGFQMGGKGGQGGIDGGG